MREILEETNTGSSDDVTISGVDYHHLIMESPYYQDIMIGSAEGDLIFYTYMTYGYGVQVPWETIEMRKKELEAWAKGICERHHCNFKIGVTANFW